MIILKLPNTGTMHIYSQMTHSLSKLYSLDTKCMAVYNCRLEKVRLGEQLERKRMLGASTLTKTRKDQKPWKTEWPGITNYMDINCKI